MQTGGLLGPMIIQGPSNAKYDIQRFSIDGHTMTVMANDFVPVQRYRTNVVTLGIGRRADDLVTANEASNTAVWMRSNISTICSITKQPFALAAIYYDRAYTSKAPISSACNIPGPGTCANGDLASPCPSTPSPPLAPRPKQWKSTSSSTALAPFSGPSTPSPSAQTKTILFCSWLNKATFPILRNGTSRISGRILRFALSSTTSLPRHTRCIYTGITFKSSPKGQEPGTGPHPFAPRTRSDETCSRLGQMGIS